MMWCRVQSCTGQESSYDKVVYVHVQGLGKGLGESLTGTDSPSGRTEVLEVTVVTAARSVTAPDATQPCARPGGDGPCSVRCVLQQTLG